MATQSSHKAKLNGKNKVFQAYNKPIFASQNATRTDIQKLFRPLSPSMRQLSPGLHAHDHIQSVLQNERRKYDEESKMPNHPNLSNQISMELFDENLTVYTPDAKSSGTFQALTAAISNSINLDDDNTNYLTPNPCINLLIPSKSANSISIDEDLQAKQLQNFEDFDDDMAQWIDGHRFSADDVKMDCPLSPQTPIKALSEIPRINTNVVEGVTDEIAIDGNLSDTELDSATPSNLDIDGGVRSPITPMTPFSPKPKGYLSPVNASKFQWNAQKLNKLSDFSSGKKRGTPPPWPESPMLNSDSLDDTDIMYLMQQHLIQQSKRSNELLHGNKFVHFDRGIYSAEHDKVVMISSKGISKGIFEWKVKIMRCDIYQQEIGVIGCNLNSEIDINSNGIKGTKEFGARAVYGNELWTDSVYYGSWNSNGKKRCYRDLRDKHHIGWCSGDVIKVKLDLDSWKIKFWLNDVRVRKSISLEAGKTYYPAIGFSGHCVYTIVSL